MRHTDRQHTYVAIMAGGIGSRFWPASRTARPKQFLDVMGTGKSLLRMTFERFLPLVPAERIYIVTNAQYQAQIMEHLPELHADQILCEPSRNNTAPCVAYTACRLQAIDANANFIVAPSDHIITDEPEFIRVLRQGLAFTAEQDALLTLGMRPSRPDTGYGYIHFSENAVQPGIYPVKRFTEKPPLDKAKSYLKSGDHLWNAGIFLWRAEVVLKELSKHASGIVEALKPGHKAYGTKQEQAFVDVQYPKTPSISIDYALMEKSDKVYTLPADFGWSDLGTWASLHARAEKDKQENLVQGGEARLVNTTNSLIRLPKGKVALIRGLEDFIVVDEGDVLLIYPKSEEQTIKAEREQMQDKFEVDIF